MSDKIYHTRKNMSWQDVKHAMARVKKFRKQGFYLEVEEQAGLEYDLSYATAEDHSRRITYKLKTPPYYTTRVWGPAVKT